MSEPDGKNAFVKRPRSGGSSRPLEGDHAALHRRGRLAPARIGADRAHARAPRLRRVCGTSSTASRTSIRSSAVTGNQAIQQVRAGLKAIYVSGWQVAADTNNADADVPGPEPLSVRQRPLPDQADQQLAARRPTRTIT